MNYLIVSVFFSSMHESTPGTEEACLEGKIHFLVIFMAMRDNKIRGDMTGITTISLPGEGAKREGRRGD